MHYRDVNWLPSVSSSTAIGQPYERRNRLAVQTQERDDGYEIVFSCRPQGDNSDWIDRDVWSDNFVGGGNAGNPAQYVASIWDGPLIQSYDSASDFSTENAFYARKVYAIEDITPSGDHPYLMDYVVSPVVMSPKHRPCMYSTVGQDTVRHDTPTASGSPTLIGTWDESAVILSIYKINPSATTDSYLTVNSVEVPGSRCKYHSAIGMNQIAVVFRVEAGDVVAWAGDASVPTVNTYEFSWILHQR